MATKQPLGQSAVDYGSRYLGTPYVWGGRSPNGFDCSGFVGYTYQQLGVNLPRTSAAQWAYLKGRGKAININQLQPGDLVFFGKGRVSDVKMYAGNGMLIGASGGRKLAGSVKKLPLGYRKDYMGFAAVSRNVNAAMPGVEPRTPSSQIANQLQTQQQKRQTAQPTDPNARGTNNIWEQAMKRQAIMNAILKPSATLWQRQPIIGEEVSPLEVEQGVL